MDPLESNARTCPSTKQHITTVKNSRKLKYKHMKHNALIIQRYFQKGTFKDLKERIQIKLLNDNMIPFPFRELMARDPNTGTSNSCSHKILNGKICICEV